jgi:uncharacterized membrane protein
MKIALARASLAASLCALSIAAWLYFPSIGGALDRERPLRVVVYDGSKSAVSRDVNGGSGLRSALTSEARTAREMHEDLCVIGFGAEVKRVFGPGSPDDFIARAAASDALRVRDDESRLASALDVARELFASRPRERSRLCLLVDRTYTGADPRPALERIRDDGVAIEWIEMPPASAPDAAIAALIAPETIEPGAPLSIACDVVLRRGSRTPSELEPRLHVRCVRPSGVLERDLLLDVPAAIANDEDGYASWRVRCDLERADPGRTLVEASVHVHGDVVPENDSASATITCGGAIVVGCVLGSDEQDRPPSWLAKIAASGGVQALPVRAADLAAELGSLDVLVTGDVPLASLPAQLIASFVERGGGWLSLAGFESWRAFLQPIDASVASDEHTLLDLLPLEPIAGDPRTRDVLFVIDGSGSMVGEPFERARAAIAPLIALASSRDRVGVAIFSASLGDTVPLFAPQSEARTSESLRAAEEKLASLVAPGGPTALFASLETIAQRRSSAQGDALVFVLSDGRDVSEPAPAVRARAIVEKLGATRTRLAVVAVGEDPDLDLLRALVPEGHSLIAERTLASAEALREVRALFEREISSERTREGTDLFVLPATAELARADGLGSDVLAAEIESVHPPWPATTRFVRVQKRENAAVLWTSRDGDPLLAVQRVGLGECAAIAFAIPEWAPAWSERADLLGPLVRALGRGKRALEPRVALRGDELEIDRLEPTTPPVLEASIFPADAASNRAPLARTLLCAPSSGSDPRTRRMGLLPRDLASDLDARDLRVEVRARGASAAAPALFDLALVADRAPEFVFPRQRLSRSETSERTDSEHEPADSARARTAVRPAAPRVLALGLALLALAALLGFFARRRA